jgi:signal peptidase I
MQPTLNGIIGYPTAEPPPNIAVRALHKAVYGRSYLDILAKSDEAVVQHLEEVKRYGFFTYTRIQTDKNVYFAHAPKATVQNYFNVGFGRPFRAGEPIVRGYVDTGDHVFVDKFTYHFRKPERAEVFVFSTAGIPLLTPPGQPSQYYIKRLAGVPGDTLRIDPPRLFLGEGQADDPRFQKVMSGSLENPKDGYRGYGNGVLVPGYDQQVFVDRMRHLSSPRETFTVPDRAYVALGDNSYNSYDSRGWGTVPESNVMGRAVLVYWPFIPHWGRIR